MASRLQEKYMKEVAPALMEKFGYKNVMEIPKLDKIVINMGIGDARENPKGLEKAVEEMENCISEGNETNTIIKEKFITLTEKVQKLENLLKTEGII